ncbi:MAG: hypothetical protein JSV63_00610 [Candidatus Aenigmatarchaeota archaeon]|nr:MAG: hypothetical protein JSV63_00610 [Candidatus Aenigmarchaeota archaeon]
MSILTNIPRKARYGAALVGALGAAGLWWLTTRGPEPPPTLDIGKYEVVGTRYDGGSDPITGKERPYWVIMEVEGPSPDVGQLVFLPRCEQQEYSHRGGRRRRAHSHRTECKDTAESLADSLNGKTIEVHRTKPGRCYYTRDLIGSCVVHPSEIEIDDSAPIAATNPPGFEQ